MQITPRKLRRLAAMLAIVPAGMGLLAQVIIWAIPGCNPNPYALGECMVAGYNMAALLIVVGIGGFGVALALGICVSVPLVLASIGFGYWQRRKARHGD